MAGGEVRISRWRENWVLGVEVGIHFGVHDDMGSSGAFQPLPDTPCVNALYYSHICRRQAQCARHWHSTLNMDLGGPPMDLSRRQVWGWE